MAEKNLASKINYMSGFGNYFSSEAESGSLPAKHNTPQKLSQGLFTEQLNGASFMTARVDNKHTWLYKKRPSAGNYVFRQKKQENLFGRPFEATATPNQLRWLAFDIPDSKTDFVDGLITVAGNGDFNSIRGSAIHIYRANTSMTNRYFSNSDGELLFVPELGAFRLFTELGEIDLKPGEICLIPAGLKFKIELVDKQIRGYLLENFGPYLRLPELGPIGAHGLAYPRHFLCPTAKYEDIAGEVEMVVKFQDKLWSAALSYSPLDVVAWHGNYVPYKYDLSLFQVVNSVSYDHQDPSIFTVLTSPSGVPGIPNVDFVIFPPRWSVAENTFRPPYFHRNCMNELMGLVLGKYESRPIGFVPGGITLHNRFAPHGPDLNTYQNAVNAELAPQKMDGTLAIMFESSLTYQPTSQVLQSSNLDKTYISVWQGLA